jgi:hypothetical protein
MNAEKYERWIECAADDAKAAADQLVAANREKR